MFLSRLEQKVQMLESQQRGQLEDLKEGKNQLQVHLHHGYALAFIENYSLIFVTATV